MAQKNEFCPEMLSALKNANSILLCTHVSPDGDAIGATLAMGLGLRALGKQVVWANDDPVPQQYRILPSSEAFVRPAALAGRKFDAALAIDAADEKRLGECRAAFFSAPVTMQMDHHSGNPQYAQINVVDAQASAAGCVVFRCLKGLNVALTPEIAACLYCAVSTDTGNFRFGNTTPEAFAMTAELMETGFDLAYYARMIHLLREEKNVRLLGRALCTLKVFGGGRCAGMVITKADYRDAQALPEHNNAIVNYALDMPGVEMAYLAEEREDGQVKASLRSLPPWNVADIARQFGGGGHMLAAGLKYCGTLEELQRELEKQMLRLLGCGE